MSKAYLAGVIRKETGVSMAVASKTAGSLMEGITRTIKKNGSFTLPGFGTFTVKKLRARNGVNPSSGEKIKIKASKTVRFKASPTLRGRV